MSSIEVIDDETLRRNGSRLFEGADHGGVGVSFFLVDAPPGGGPSLHVHPYAEVFVVHEGQATFTIGDESIVAVGGQVVVAPGERPHKFQNTGSERLRMTTIHPNERTITEWLP